MLGTVRKAGAVLDLFGAERPELGVTEVAEALGIPKSSAHALLDSLCEIELVRRTPQNRYRLGWRLLGLSRVLLETTAFRVEALHGMRELVDRFGETVHLAVLEGAQVVYVEKLEGTRAVRIGASQVGARLPAHCSGVGKVLLAHRPWREVEATVTHQGLQAFTPNTITRVDRLQAELERVRAQGFAYDREEVMAELCCVAAPIWDHTGQVVAALSISAPAYRFRQNHVCYKGAVVRAAGRVSENLGYRPPAECRSRRSSAAGG